MACKLAFYSATPVASAALLALLWGCSTPFQERASSELRHSVIDSSERELIEAQGAPQERILEREPGRLSFPPERMEELRGMGGIDSYPPTIELVGPLGTDLLGTPVDRTRTLRISLEQAITSAVQNNLALQIARVDPAIRQAQVVAAQAAFDWVFFADFQWALVDQPSAVPVIGGIPIGSPAQESQRVSYTTGVRKDLASGGRFTAEQGQVYTDNTSPGISFAPDPSNATFVTFAYEQPLLRGFGSDVALSEIRIGENVERDAIEALRQTLLDTIVDTERAYWELVRARVAMQIQQRLLERGIRTRDVLESRLGVDARPAEHSDAVARVEQRRASVIRAENDVRQTSDRLKLLINDPMMTVGTETLLVPVDRPLDEPIRFSLLGALNAALAQRPELQRSILEIDNATIRQVVARNARLPMLNFAVEATLRGLARDVGDAYDDVNEARFVNWLMSVAFEQPIGNRAAEALYRQRRLEALRATLSYRRAVQLIVQEVKAALRNVQTNYRLIQQTRSARLAAAENLRTLTVLEETIASLTPEFLNLKFQRQEGLAATELEELRSLIDYNTSLAELSRATAESLDRNGIRFIVPDAGDFDTAGD